MTRTCDSTNHINQLRFATQLASYQRPCIATNVPDHLPIQLLPIANPRPSFRTNQLHHYETKMLTKHACFLAMFLLTNDTLSIELNVEISENPNNNDRWKQNANTETAPAWSEHTNQKILREILWITKQGKIGSGETQMAIHLMNISAIRVFSNPTPLFPLKRWTNHRNWCRCQDGHERRLPQWKGQISLNIDSSVQSVKKLDDIVNTKVTIFFFNRDTLTKFGPPTDKGNWTFALDLVQESL